MRESIRGSDAVEGELLNGVVPSVQYQPKSGPTLTTLWMEWVSPDGKVYSPEMDDYIPLCRSCHLELDGHGYPIIWGVTVPPHARSYGAIRREGYKSALAGLG
jgi:hypothetical protein